MTPTRRELEERLTALEDALEEARDILAAALDGEDEDPEENAPDPDQE